MKLKVPYHQDPSHGWLEVKRTKLVELGVDLNKITPFSYQSQDGQTVYLEEDCDAAHLVLRLKADCVPFEVVSESVNSDHWIRHLSSFQP